jgi:2-phospho-L-lactate guanylyltransferase (CobY/MobA/RfbA family)
MSEETTQETPAVEETTQEVQKPMSFDDGIIKVNLAELNKPQEDAVQEQIPDASDAIVEQPEDAQSSEAVVEQVQESVQADESVIEEITNEEVAEAVEELEEQVEQAIVEKDLGIELPENLQKAVDFMNETGGSLEDYVKLNTDYASLNEGQLLREYYESTKPHLDKEEIDFLMEDNFAYDEDIDEDRDIRRKKLAHKEELAKAKGHLEGLKGKYYEEIKAGSKLNPEQKNAVDFFNRYKENNEEATKVADKQRSTFDNKTEQLFSKDFKGFDFSVGEKKFRFKVNNADQVKESQSNINNFVKKFLNDKNEMNDAAGYHKSLYTAMNADAIASHFYEQGKSDAIKGTMSKAKNIDMDPRGTHENVVASNGWSVKSISSGQSSSKLRIKSKK